MRSASLLLAALLSGCVQLGYTARWVDQAPTAEALQQLQVGSDDLTRCLARLGAPHFVWEYAGDGAALGWAYGDGSSWGVGASYSFGKFTNVSFDFASSNMQLPGVVLWFDSDLRLQAWRQGKLRDLTAGLRRRPASLEGD